MYSTLPKQFIFLLLLLAFLFSCQTKKQAPLSFYYWKQTFELTKEQQKLLKETKTERLYVKFFDVILDENNQPKPISKIQFKERTKLEVIPCVFIQNDVFRYANDVHFLAKKISHLIDEIADHQSLNIKEIQIDCDWTKGTRDDYFAFLEELKNQQGETKLACTIRLHQIKYQERSGIPPVEKGLLMCYNMDDIEQISTPNSIVSSKVLTQYVNEDTQYPIKLDLALPIYQWGLIFRLGKLSVISNDLSLQDLPIESISRVGENTYKVKEDVVANETNFCKGDLIRFETSSPKTLVQLAEYFKKTNLTFNQVIFYHISQEHLNKYNASTLSSINRLIP
jgi:hypothetical protein